MTTKMSLAKAVDLTRTGDIWLFRGNSGADRAIQTLTNSPVNHVGMAVVLDDLPPLMWHAELGRSLPDVWAGEHRRGAQLHVLSDAVEVWATKYGQRAWLRQLDPLVGRAGEDAILRTIARLDGTPFPTSAAVFTRWLTSKRPLGPLGPLGRRSWRSWRERLAQGSQSVQETQSAQGNLGNQGNQESLESAYCAEVVARTYQEMGLLTDHRPPGWYDPGRFWSGDDLDLVGGSSLGREIEVDVPTSPAP